MHKTRLSSCFLLALLLFSECCIASSSSEENIYNYDDECDDYDNAYYLGDPIVIGDMSQSGILDDAFLLSHGLSGTGPNGMIPGEYGVDWDITKAFFCTNENNYNTRFYFQGYGLPARVPITAWLVIPPSNRVHELFTGGYAEHQVPMQPSYSGYSSGRGLNDPNMFEINSHDGSFTYVVDLDFNPDQEYQVPLPNSLATVTQQNFPSNIGGYYGLNQNTYKTSGKIQDIAREYLRYYNSDGSPVIDLNTGYPELVRSPVRFSYLPIVGHPDLATHGTDPSTFCPSAQTDYECGDHYPIALFSLDNKIEI